MMYHQNKMHKRISPDFIKSIKNMPQLPLKKPQNKTKENHAPKQSEQSKVNNSKPQFPIKSANSTVVEQDFTKIAKSYVLEGNRLKKSQPIFAECKQTKTKEEINQQDLVTYKEKVRLQYLQQKGFLKPEQAELLKKVRSQNYFPLALKEANKLNDKKKHPEPRIATQEIEPVKSKSNYLIKNNISQKNSYPKIMILDDPSTGKNVPYHEEQYADEQHYDNFYQSERKPRYEDMHYYPAYHKPQRQHPYHSNYPQNYGYDREYPYQTEKQDRFEKHHSTSLKHYQDRQNPYRKISHYDAYPQQFEASYGRKDRYYPNQTSNYYNSNYYQKPRYY